MGRLRLAIYLLLSTLTLVPDNQVSAALPSDELWRESLINNIVGFARNTSGGAGGSLCRVTNLNNSGPGSLRACAEHTDRQWIIFDVSGTISLSSVILVKSNKTIDGRGANITIVNQGLIVGRWGSGSATDNVIVHNIKFDNITSNCNICIGEDASNVWIDHVTFDSPRVDETIYVGSGDGSYTGAGPKSITVSWNRFIGHWPPSGLPGDSGASFLISDQGNTEDIDTTVTIHHNHFDTMQSRQPMVHWAKVHAFNNYHNKPYTCVEGRSNAQYYSENDIFEAESQNGDGVLVKTWEGGPFPAAANVKVVSPWLINGATVQQINASTIFNPSSYYSYTAETADEALRAKIVSNAGWQNVTSPTANSLQAPTNLVVK